MQSPKLSTYLRASNCHGEIKRIRDPVTQVLLYSQKRSIKKWFNSKMVLENKNCLPKKFP